MGVLVAPKDEHQAPFETFDILCEVIYDFCNGIEQNLPFDQMKEEAEEIENLVREILDFLLGQEDDTGSSYESDREEDSDDKNQILKLERELDAAEESIQKLTRQVGVYSESANMLKERLVDAKNTNDLQLKQIQQLESENLKKDEKIVALTNKNNQSESNEDLNALKLREKDCQIESLKQELEGAKEDSKKKAEEKWKIGKRKC